ncbi:hypothetical protein O6H91_21G071700 [Diphasiastrum complanatum]|uniref:Uncharacterized protein n=2 Tax=Diphasiastrum complanatum TaxID=34168 RepID=A0ACC2ALM6_DIPCM|nr:hypothetical protein O6H91_23G060900 [Diphasiastrum complanatum]KAJ7518488.1 hypothetical protein O6H91_21G071700 [Diphasiastrum complanatum]
MNSSEVASFTPTHHSKIDYCSMPINSTLRFSSIPVSQRILTSSPAFLSPNSLLLASSPEFSHHLTPSLTWNGDHIVPTAASEIVEWERGSTSLEELFEAETRKDDQSFSEYGDDCFSKSADFSGFSNSNWNSNSTSSSHQTTLWDLLRSDTQDCPQLRSCHKRKSLSWKGMIQALTSKSKRNLFSVACNKNSTPQCPPQLNLPASQVCYLSARSTQVARLRKRRCVPYRRQIISFFSCIKPG